MSEDMDKAQKGEGEPRRKPLAELTDEELRVLAAEATAADEEVQTIVRQVYKAVLEERARIRYHLWQLTVRTPLWLLPELLDFVARQSRLEDLLADHRSDLKVLLAREKRVSLQPRSPFRNL